MPVRGSPRFRPFDIPMSIQASIAKPSVSPIPESRSTSAGDVSRNRLSRYFSRRNPPTAIQGPVRLADANHEVLFLSMTDLTFPKFYRVSWRCLLRSYRFAFSCQPCRHFYLRHLAIRHNLCLTTLRIPVPANIRHPTQTHNSPPCQGVVKGAQIWDGRDSGSLSQFWDVNVLNGQYPGVLAAVASRCSA
jgi:hypothetical protein